MQVTDVWARVRACAEERPDGCWEWLGPYHLNVPILAWDYERSVARMLWHATHPDEPLAEDVPVLRTCGRGWCVRPEHLTYAGEEIREHRVAGYCANGHPRTVHTTYYYTYGGRRRRACSLCRKRAEGRRPPRNRPKLHASREEYVEGQRQRMLRVWEERRAQGVGQAAADHPWRGPAVLPAR